MLMPFHLFIAIGNDVKKKSAYLEPTLIMHNLFGSGSNFIWVDFRLGAHHKI
ncbi:hypothetical protein Hanom_Chr00s005146g01728071 [Helianthus anomalus]